MKELSLFSGAGGGILGTKLLGWTTIGYVEYEKYCQKSLKQRIYDGILDAAPIFGDIKKFISQGYAEAYQGMVDILTAGFPCQEFSVAGQRKGSSGERNMWPETWECIRIIRPDQVLLENVPGLLTSSVEADPEVFIQYFGSVCGDLAEIGYNNIRYCVLGADDVGAPHRRKRLWIVADSHKEGLESRECKPSQQTPDRATERQGGRVSWWDTDPADIPDAGHSKLPGREHEESGGEGMPRNEPAPCNSETISDTQEKRQRGGSLQNNTRNKSEGEQSGDSSRGETEQHLREQTVKSGLGGMVNGVASIVDKTVENEYIFQYGSKNKNEQLSKKISKSNENSQGMSDLRREEKKITGSPQRQGPDEQFIKQLNKTLSEMSQGYSCERRRLGAWENAIKTGELQDLRNIIYTDTLSRNQKEFLVWFASMQGREWSFECFGALEKTPRVANNILKRVDRLKAIGNGQVPLCVVKAWEILNNGFENL